MGMITTNTSPANSNQGMGMSSNLRVIKGGLSGGDKKMWKFFKRMVKFRQMDFEVAIEQMIYLLIAPKTVYRKVYYHRQTKGQWARDDPAFFVLICFFISLASLAFSLVFSVSVPHAFRLLFSFLFIHFIIPGLVIATFTWWFSNKFLRVSSVHSVEQKVEWGFAFDLHCNSFIPVFFFLFLVQLLFIPILLKDNFFATFLGNTLYLVALIHYTFITYLGYNTLPFLQRTIIFLYPIFLYLVSYVVSLFFVNVSKAILGVYFTV